LGEMRLVLTTVMEGSDATSATENVQFHLAAGVDLVLASVSDSAVAESLRTLGERVHTVPSGTDRTNLARLAAAQHAADWIISADPQEFWWPRGEDLKEVLAPIPERYTIVQGLRRDFPVGEMTRRSTPEDGKGAVLRPVFRADSNAVVDEDGAVQLRRNVPLRAWYPIEVMRLGVNTPRADRDLVDDARLYDALQALRRGDSALTFRFPDIVEDARYAAECAAVGEVDLPKLEQYVTELEQRVEWLEQRFWPRVWRRLARLGRRSA
jgi:hypothetical protein